MLAPCWVAVHCLMYATGHAVRDVSDLVGHCQLTDQLCTQITPKCRFLLPIFHSLLHSRPTHHCSCVASCVWHVLCMRCQLLRCMDVGGMGCVYVTSVALLDKRPMACICQFGNHAVVVEVAAPILKEWLA